MPLCRLWKLLRGGAWCEEGRWGCLVGEAHACGDAPNAVGWEDRDSGGEAEVLEDVDARRELSMPAPPRLLVLYCLQGDVVALLSTGRLEEKRRRETAAEAGDRSGIAGIAMDDAEAGVCAAFIAAQPSLDNAKVPMALLKRSWASQLPGNTCAQGKCGGKICYIYKSCFHRPSLRVSPVRQPCLLNFNNVLQSNKGGGCVSFSAGELETLESGLYLLGVSAWLA